MNFVALKMLVGDRLKYLALIAGVSFAALLITQPMARGRKPSDAVSVAA